MAASRPRFDGPVMRAEIDDFILYLATERGLSDNYQISTRLSLEGFLVWLERRKIVASIGVEALKQKLETGEALPDVDVKAGNVTHAEISDEDKRQILSGTVLALLDRHGVRLG